MRSAGPEIALTLPSSPRSLEILRNVLGQTARLCAISEEELEGVILAANEACANVIQHCYGMDESHRIDVTVKVAADRILVEIRDFGRYRDTVDFGSGVSDASEPGGLGLRIMRAVMDEVSFRPARGAGTILTLVKYRAKGES